MSLDDIRWERVGRLRYVEGHGLFVDLWSETSTLYLLHPAVSDDNRTGWALLGHRDDGGDCTHDFVTAVWWEEDCYDPTVVMEREEESPPSIISLAAKGRKMGLSEMRWERIGRVRYVEGYGLFVGDWTEASTSYFLYPAVSNAGEAGWSLIARRYDEDGSMHASVTATWWKEFCYDPSVVMEEQAPLPIISRAVGLVVW